MLYFVGMNSTDWGRAFDLFLDVAEVVAATVLIVPYLTRGFEVQWTAKLR